MAAFPSVWTVYRVALAPSPVHEGRKCVGYRRQDNADLASAAIAIDFAARQGPGQYKIEAPDGHTRIYLLMGSGGRVRKARIKRPGDAIRLLRWDDAESPVPRSVAPRLAAHKPQPAATHACS